MRSLHSKLGEGSPSGCSAAGLVFLLRSTVADLVSWDLLKLKKGVGERRGENREKEKVVTTTNPLHSREKRKWWFIIFFFKKRKKTFSFGLNPLSSWLLLKLLLDLSNSQVLFRRSSSCCSLFPFSLSPRHSQIRKQSLQIL